MDAFNNTLFLWINAPAHPSAWVVSMATIFANDLIWAIPCLMIILWLRAGNRMRRALIAAAVAGVIGLLINQCIGFFYWHPRPFMIPIGRTLIPHAPDSSFPSDHLTLWWAVAFSLLSQRHHRLGLALSLIGVPIAWARIYLGVHFPLDMVGAAAVAILSVPLARHTARRHLTPVYLLALKIHRRLFAPLIASGWIHR